MFRAHYLSLLLQVEEEREWEEGQGKGSGESREQSTTEDQVDKLTVYKSILELLKPGETVTKVDIHPLY